VTLGPSVLDADAPEHVLRPSSSGKGEEGSGVRHRRVQLLDRFELESGEVLRNVEQAYFLDGTLNDARDNLVVVFHALYQADQLVGGRSEVLPRRLRTSYDYPVARNSSLSPRLRPPPDRHCRPGRWAAKRCRPNGRAVPASAAAARRARRRSARSADTGPSNTCSRAMDDDFWSVDRVLLKAKRIAARSRLCGPSFVMVMKVR